MPLTLADVAKRAGVSVKTVSRVVNNEDRVTEKTRRRVWVVIEELGYAPNLWAQRLARGRAGLVGLLIHDATPSYVMEVINAANSQPHSHIHDPGAGVGGHCIPVYPHFIMSERTTLIATARKINETMPLHVVNLAETLLHRS